MKVRTSLRGQNFPCSVTPSCYTDANRKHANLLIDLEFNGIERFSPRLHQSFQWLKAAIDLTTNLTGSVPEAREPNSISVENWSDHYAPNSTFRILARESFRSRSGDETIQ